MLLNNSLKLLKRFDGQGVVIVFKYRQQSFAGPWACSLSFCLILFV